MSKTRVSRYIKNATPENIKIVQGLAEKLDNDVDEIFKVVETFCPKHSLLYRKIVRALTIVKEIQNLSIEPLNPPI